MSNEEKFMAIQLLGKLLEAQYTYVKTDLEGKPMTPPYPKSVLDTADKLKVQSKLMEVVESIKVNEPKAAKSSVKLDYDPNTTVASNGSTPHTTNGTV